MGQTSPPSAQALSYSPPHFLSASPSHVPNHGPTTVTLTGLNLGFDPTTIVLYVNDVKAVVNYQVGELVHGRGAVEQLVSLVGGLDADG